MMKLVLIIFNITLEEDLMELLKRLEVSCLTQWPRLHGKGKSTAPRFESAVWPGANSGVMVVTDEAQAKSLMKEIQVMRETTGKREGIKAFLLNVEDMTGDI